MWGKLDEKVWERKVHIYSRVFRRFGKGHFGNGRFGKQTDIL